MARPSFTCAAVMLQPKIGSLTCAVMVQDGKMIKSVIMPGNKQAIVVYRLPDGRVYCSDANSTAFEFPLSNAKVITEGAC